MQFSNVTQSAITPIFSPSFKYLATVTGQNITIKDASYLDLKDYSIITIKQKDKIPNSPFLKFSPDSRLIAVKLFKKIEIYDIQGNLKIRIQEDYEIDNMIWSQDPGSCQLLVFYKNTYSCLIYNLQNGSISKIKCTKLSSQNGCSFSKGSHPGVFMAMLQRNGVKDSIGIYFTRTWQLVNYINLETSFDIRKIEFADNGTLIAIEKLMNFKLFFVDMFRGVFQEYGDKPYVMGFNCNKFSNSSKFLALGAYDNCIHLLNTLTWKLIIEMEIACDIDLTKTVWLKQGTQGFYPVQGNKGKLSVVKKQQKDKDKEKDPRPPGISMIEFSPNDEFLAVRIDMFASSVFIYSVKTLTLVTVITFVHQVKDFKWIENQNGEIDLCIANGTSNLLFWRSSDPQEAIYEIKIPIVANNELKITEILQVKDRKLIFSSSRTKNFVYASY